MTDNFAMPASFAQERMYLLHHMSRGQARYNIAGLIRLAGPLRPDTMHATVQALASRHEVLRTALRPDRTGAVLQIISSHSEIEIRHADTSAVDAPLPAAVAWAEKLAAEPFDLDYGTVMRAGLVRLGAKDHLLAVVVHHAAADGLSLRIMVEEAAALYAGLSGGVPAGLPSPPIQYADYAVWQRAQAAAGAFVPGLAFWAAQLRDVRCAPLPACPPPAADAVSAVRLSASQLRPLNALARAAGASTFMALLAAFAAALRRNVPAERPLVVVTPVSGRDRPELERLVGCFVNTIPLVIEADGAPGALLGHVRTVCLDALDHGNVPFEELLRHPAIRHARQGLASILFSVQDALPEVPSLGPGLTASYIDVPSAPAAFDLAAELAVEPNGSVRGHLQARPGCLGQALLDSIARDFAAYTSGGG